MKTTTPTVFKEFTDITFPASLIARGFLDESWHNDAAPRAVRSMGSEQLTVFVDHDDPEQREITGSKKFMLVIEREYGEDQKLVGEFNDEATLLRAIDAVLTGKRVQS